VLELPFCSSLTFQIFLNELSEQNPSELKVLFLDNGAFHKAKGLAIPENIILIFLPPYSPELNPAEKVWWTIKREISLKSYKTLTNLQNDLTRVINNVITKKKIMKLTAYKIFLSAYKTIICV
jgi:transposase